MMSKITGSAGLEQLRIPVEAARGPEGAQEPRGAASVEPEPFQAALERLGKEIDKGEKLVAKAMRGGSHLDAGDLIALQAGIYRYSEAVDLAAKLVDRASNAVRTTLQSPGG
jgi:hypothetical protein